MKRKIAKKIVCLGLSLSLIASSFSTVFADSLYKVEDFPNLIDLEANLTNQPYSYYQVSDFSTFMDKGAWHGYSLPMIEDKDNLGAFSGPTILFKHKSESIAINLSDAISKLSVIKDGKPVDLEFANPNLTYYPGKIVQSFEKDGLKIYIELIFATYRTALIKTSFENLSKNDIKLDISWSGKIFDNYINNKKTYDISPRIENNNSGINVIFDGKNEGLAEETKNNKFFINFFEKVKTTVSSDKLSYKTSLEETKILKPSQKLDIYRTESFVFNKEEYQKEMENITELNFSNAFE